MATPIIAPRTSIAISVLKTYNLRSDNQGHTKRPKTYDAFPPFGGDTGLVEVVGVWTHCSIRNGVRIQVTSRVVQSSCRTGRTGLRRRCEKWYVSASWETRKRRRLLCSAVYKEAHFDIDRAQTFTDCAFLAKCNKQIHEPQLLTMPTSRKLER